MRLRVLGASLAIALVAAGVLYWRRADGPPYEAISLCTLPQVADPPATKPFDAPPAIRLQRVSELSSGTAIEPWVDGERLLLALRKGEVWLLDPATGDEQRVLDLSDRTMLRDEGGLVGMAIAPDGRHVYLHLTDPEGTSHILELAILDGALDPSSEREVLAQPHPAQLHNGGAIAFGADGLLYVGFGDGGGRPSDAARVVSLEDWDGKILRIDPRGERDGEYTVPEDNPFVDTADARPEIWLTGMRNPYRFAFDPATDDLWIGDVGEACYEELTHVRPGERGLDLGFPTFEGFHEFLGGDPGGTRFPSLVYTHEVGCAVIPGVVSRDPALPELDGALLFSDFCAGGVSAVRVGSGDVETGQLETDVEGVLSFGVGPAGEAYMLTVGGVLRIERQGAR